MVDQVREDRQLADEADLAHDDVLGDLKLDRGEVDEAGDPGGDQTVRHGLRLPGGDGQDADLRADLRVHGFQLVQGADGVAAYGGADLRGILVEHGGDAEVIGAP